MMDEVVERVKVVAFVEEVHPYFDSDWFDPFVADLVVFLHVAVCVETRDFSPLIFVCREV